MSWEISLVFTLLGTSALLLYLARNYYKDKVLFLLFLIFGLFFIALNLNTSITIIDSANITNSTTANYLKTNVGLGYNLFIVIIIFIVGYFIINFIIERVEEIKKRKMGVET